MLSKTNSELTIEILGLHKRIDDLIDQMNENFNELNTLRDMLEKFKANNKAKK